MAEKTDLFSPRWRIVIESNPGNHAPKCTFYEYVTFQEASFNFRKLYRVFGFMCNDIITQYEPKVIKTTPLNKGAATITLTEI